MRITRHVQVFGWLAVAASIPAFCTNNPSSVTVLLEFENDLTPAVLGELKQETQSILRDTGVQFDWRLKNNVVSGESFEELIVVKFRGRCRYEPVPFLYDERGPLAFARSTNGAVLPFAEVECTRVLESVMPQLRRDGKRAEALLGRALGRVLAHEIYHVLARTDEHSRRGVARESLRASELVGDRLDLDPEGIASIRRRWAAPAVSRPAE